MTDTNPTKPRPTLWNTTYRGYVISALSMLMLAAFEAVRTGGQGQESILHLRRDVNALQTQVARIESKIDHDQTARDERGRLGNLTLSQR